jgi:hypothetical protein
MTTSDLEGHVRAICMALPEVTERLSHGSPAFFVKKQFVALMSDGHHEHHFAHMWCVALPGAQQELIAMAPDRIFRPPYVGARGWIGVRLDAKPDFEEIEMFCEDAYRAVATKRQIALLECGTSPR